MVGGLVLKPKTTHEGKNHDPSDEGHNSINDYARAIAGAFPERRCDEKTAPEYGSNELFR